MERKLDKSRPFATLYGNDPNIKRGPNGEQPKYQQNNMYFDQRGNYISGEYQPADSEDEKRDLAERNKQLEAELAALKAQQETETSEDDLDREKIVEQLQNLGVKVDGRLGTQKLYEQLQESLDSE